MASQVESDDHPWSQFVSQYCWSAAKETTLLADRLTDVLSKDLMAFPTELYRLSVKGVKARRARIKTRKASTKVGSTMGCLFPCFVDIVDMMKISFEFDSTDRVPSRNMRAEFWVCISVKFRPAYKKDKIPRRIPCKTGLNEQIMKIKHFWNN